MADWLYHGRNAYAYLIARYDALPPMWVPTFDFVSVQLYEGWSSANHKLVHITIPAVHSLSKFPLILK